MRVIVRGVVLLGRFVLELSANFEVTALAGDARLRGPSVYQV